MHIPDFEEIAQVELDDEPYQYDLVGLWRNAEGFYLGTDSGCSCPTPWESHTADDLTGPLSLDQVAQETVSLWSAAGRKVDESAIQAFLNTAIASFLRTLTTDWVIQDPLDFPYGYRRFATQVQDVHGVKWTRERYCDDFTAGDNTKDETELDYPVIVLALSTEN